MKKIVRFSPHLFVLFIISLINANSACMQKEIKKDLKTKFTYTEHRGEKNELNMKIPHPIIYQTAQQRAPATPMQEK